MSDLGASVIAKLKNKSKETGKPLQLYLQLFCQEEFLRRVALSRYADDLIMKGGMFIFTLTNFESRSTIDIDFLLRNLPNSIETVQKVVDEIIRIETGNSFISFETISFEEISINRKYRGVSFQLIGKISNTRTPVNIDFGVGDIVVPKPQKRRIPVQIDGFESPEISTYTLESTIAEKFDAMIQRMELTSRMKDYYDIYYLANSFDFDGNKLKKAVVETLQNRNTSYDSNSLNQVVGLGINSDMQQKWRQFIRRLKLQDLAFYDVLLLLNTFLSPIWNAIVNNQDFSLRWNSKISAWEK